MVQIAEPDRPIFVGTFHKTGTVLLRGIFEEVARRLDLTFCEPKEVFWKTREFAHRDFDIFFDGGTRFLRHRKLFGLEARAVISIRDPRDVVIGSALYHARAPEKWLHVPSEKFAGRTYQQALNALESDHQRLVFEMDHSSALTIANMLAVDQNDPRIAVVRLDRLIVDCNYEEYRRMFAFLGFMGEAPETCLEAARERSAFNRAFRPEHVNHPEPAAWRERFTPAPALAQAFETRFPGAAEKLGYEPTFLRETA